MNPAWRVLAGGPMLEIESTTVAEGMKPVTQIVTAQEGMIISGTRTISASMRLRYEDGDPFMRALVEYGELEDTGEVDDDGNVIQAFVPKGVESIPDEPDPDTVSRAEKAEGEATELRSKVTELEGQLSQAQAAHESDRGQFDAYAQNAKEQSDAFEAKVAELESQLDEATKPDENALTYESLSPQALKAEADAKGLTVARGDGQADKDPLKADYVKALQEARSGS